MLAIIKAELLAIKEKYATPRLTDLVPDEGEIAIEDLIANEGVIITLTHTGLIKRTNVSSYRSQRRGGKGVIGMATREGATEEDQDFIEHLFTASTHDHLMFFTNTGRVYVERVHEIPDMGRAAKGRSIANLLELKQGETIAALIRIEAKTGPNKEDATWQQPGFLFFATQQGTVKKTPLEDFANVRKGGIIAIGIEPGDTLIEVRLTSGQDQVVLITREGMSIRFSEEDVRAMGRPAVGVRGINLEKSDAVVALGRGGAGRDVAGCRRKWHRQADALRFGAGGRDRGAGLPATVTRRQRHHHHEGQREDRGGRRCADRAGRRRDHADHDRRSNGAHLRERHP